MGRTLGAATDGDPYSESNSGGKHPVPDPGRRRASTRKSITAAGGLEEMRRLSLGTMWLHVWTTDGPLSTAHGGDIRPISAPDQPS